MQKLRVGGVPEHFNTPWQLACEQGLFKGKGVDVEFIIYPDGTGAMCRDLSNGKLDLAITLTEGAIKHCVTNGDSIIVSPYVDTPLNWGIFVGQQSKIKHIDELAQKDFAISRFGSGSHLMACVLAEEKFSWRPDLKHFHPVGGIQALCEAVNAGQGDAFLWEIFTTKPWLQRGNIRSIGEYPTPWPCFHVTATKNIISKSKTAVFACLAVVQSIATQFNADPVYATEMIALHYPLDKDDIITWLSQTRWSDSPVVSLPLLENVMQTLVALDVCPLGCSVNEITL